MHAPEVPKCCDEYAEVKVQGDCPDCVEEIEKALQQQLNPKMARAEKRLQATYEAGDECSEDELWVWE